MPSGRKRGGNGRFTKAESASPTGPVAHPDAPPVQPSPGHTGTAPVDASLGLQRANQDFQDLRGTEPPPTPLGQRAEPRVKSEGLGTGPPLDPSAASRLGLDAEPLPKSEHKDPYVEPGSLADLVSRMTPQQIAGEVARLVALNAEHEEGRCADSGGRIADVDQQMASMRAEVAAMRAEVESLVRTQVESLRLHTGHAVASAAPLAPPSASASASRSPMCGAAPDTSDPSFARPDDRGVPRDGFPLDDGGGDWDSDGGEDVDGCPPNGASSSMPSRASFGRFSEHSSRPAGQSRFSSGLPSRGSPGDSRGVRYENRGFDNKVKWSVPKFSGATGATSLSFSKWKFTFESYLGSNGIHLSYDQTSTGPRLSRDVCLNPTQCMRLYYDIVGHMDGEARESLQRAVEASAITVGDGVAAWEFLLRRFHRHDDVAMHALKIRYNTCKFSDFADMESYLLARYALLSQLNRHPDGSFVSTPTFISTVLFELPVDYLSFRSMWLRANHPTPLDSKGHHDLFLTFQQELVDYSRILNAGSEQLAMMSYEQRQTMLRERFKDHVCGACGTRGHSSRWFGCPKHQHHDRFLRDPKEAAGTQGNTNRRGQGTVTARKIAEAADAIADILDQGNGRAYAPDGECDGHVITDALVGDGADA